MTMALMTVALKIPKRRGADRLDEEGMRSGVDAGWNGL